VHTRGKKRLSIAIGLALLLTSSAHSQLERITKEESACIDSVNLQFESQIRAIWPAFAPHSKLSDSMFQKHYPGSACVKKILGRDRGSQISTTIPLENGKYLVRYLFYEDRGQLSFSFYSEQEIDDSIKAALRNLGCSVETDSTFTFNTVFIRKHRLPEMPRAECLYKAFSKPPVCWEIYPNHGKCFQDKSNDCK